MKIEICRSNIDKAKNMLKWIGIGLCIIILILGVIAVPLTALMLLDDSYYQSAIEITGMPGSTIVMVSTFLSIPGIVIYGVGFLFVKSIIESGCKRLKQIIKKNIQLSIKEEC